jgi:hypothetical protein
MQIYLAQIQKSWESGPGQCDDVDVSRGNWARQGEGHEEQLKQEIQDPSTRGRRNLYHKSESDDIICTKHASIWGRCTIMMVHLVF